MGAYHGLMPTTNHPLAQKSEAYALWIKENEKLLKEDWDALQRTKKQIQALGDFPTFCELQYDQSDRSEQDYDRCFQPLP